MKKLLTSLVSLVLLGFFLSIGAIAGDEVTATAGEPGLKPALQSCYQATMKVDGMKGDDCVNKVKAALAGIEGVEKCDVSLEESRATVVFDKSKTEDKQIIAAVEKAGYQVQLGELNSVGEHNIPGGCVMEKSHSTDQKKGCSLKCARICAGRATAEKAKTDQK